MYDLTLNQDPVSDLPYNSHYCQISNREGLGTSL